MDNNKLSPYNKPASSAGNHINNIRNSSGNPTAPSAPGESSTMTPKVPYNISVYEHRILFPAGSVVVVYATAGRSVTVVITVKTS